MLTAAPEPWSSSITASMTTTEPKDESQPQGDEHVGGGATQDMPGVGDEAFVTGDSSIIARKGDKLIRVMYMTCSGAARRPSCLWCKSSPLHCEMALKSLAPVRANCSHKTVIVAGKGSSEMFGGLRVDVNFERCPGLRMVVRICKEAKRK